MTDQLPESPPAPVDAPPPQVSAPPIDIRRYDTIEHFQADAAVMASANWHVVAQSESSAGMNGTWVGVAIILALIGLFLFWPLLIVAVLVAILGAVNGRKELVVTYRRGAPIGP